MNRLVFRLLVRTERLLDALQPLISCIYITLVACLFAAASVIYANVVRPLLRTTLADRPALLYAHTAVSAYLLVSIAANYVRCLFTHAGRPVRGDLETPSEAPVPPPPDPARAFRTSSELWRFCKVCRGPKPPRAHHCSVCKACVLKLCHHVRFV